MELKLNITLVFLNLLINTSQDITLTGQYSSNLTGYLLYSPQATSTHVVTLLGQINQEVRFLFYPANNLSVITQVVVNGLIFEQTAQVRTANFNNYANITSNALLYFTNSSVIYFPIYGDSYMEIYNIGMNSYFIRQVCFGASKDQKLILIQDLAKKKYKIIFILHLIPISQFVLAIDPSTNLYDEFKFQQNRLILVFSSSIVIYNCVNLTLDLGTVITISYPGSLVQYIDYLIQGDLLIYSVGVTLTLYNLTTQTTLQTYTSAYMIESITKSQTIIAIKTTDFIYQYDYEVMKVITTFSVTYNWGALQKIVAFEGDRLVAFSDFYGAYVGAFQVLGMNFSYPCSAGCTGCYATYTLVNSSTCVKTALMPPPTPTPISNNNTNNTSNNTAANNSTANTSLINPSSLKYSQLADKYLSILVNSALSYIFSLSTIKAMPKFLLIFTALVNDLPFYKYHRKFEPEYPNSTIIFMQKYQLLKFLGVDDFSSKFNFLNRTHQKLTAKNDHLLRTLQFNPHDPQQIYFLYKISDYFESSMFLSIFYYCLIKLLHFVLYKTKDCHWLLKKCYKFLRDQTRWWTFLVAVIEMNVYDVAFGDGLQMLGLGLVGVFDKLNLVAMYCGFFILVFYVFAFYCVVYAEESKRYSKNLIVYSRPKLRSYFFEPTVFLLRGAIKAFVHGYFIYSYPAQIVTLFVIDIPFVVVCFVLRKNFRNRLVLILITLYFVGFMIFDLYFVLEIFTEITSGCDRELFGFVICCALGIISLLLSFVFFVDWLIETFRLIKGFFVKNKIESVRRQMKMRMDNIEKSQKVIKKNLMNDVTKINKQGKKFEKQAQLGPQTSPGINLLAFKLRKIENEKQRKMPQTEKYKLNKVNKVKDKAQNRQKNWLRIEKISKNAKGRYHGIVEIHLQKPK